MTAKESDGKELQYKAVDCIFITEVKLLTVN
jgi:hypothetical protein